jgi:pyruvate/2-oxoglutarate dehydrogenase complex dihydrolipoamide acyltransferase (E2) component
MNDLRSRWQSASEAIETDVIRSLTGATVTGDFWIDLEPALRFLERQPRELLLSRIHLYVKAAALAVLDAPSLHRQWGLLRVHDPVHADVGVSVGSSRSLAPVVVIASADLKSLAEIGRELRAGARRALREERRTTEMVDRWGRFFPFPILRRLVVRWVMASPTRRRKLVGTIQISDLDSYQIDAAQVPLVGELLLVAGAVRKSVVPGDGDRPVVRSGAMFTLHGSHRKLNGRTAGEFIGKFRALMAEPERLL